MKGKGEHMKKYITPIIAKASLAYNVKLTIEQIQFVTNNVLEEYVEERKLAG